MPTYVPWSDPLAIIAAVNASATILYVGFTAGILRATRDNTKVTRDIFESAYRPYVALAGMSLGRPTSRSETAVIFEFKNSGSVPAVDFRYAISVTIDGKPVKTDYEARTLNTLFPGEPLTVYYFPGPKEMNALESLHFFVQASYRGFDQQKHGYTGQFQYRIRTQSFLPLLSEFH